MHRFLEPPKELPSTKDDDNDDVEDVGLGVKDTGSHDMFASATGGGHAPGGTNDDVVTGFPRSTGGLSVRGGVGAVGANEPDLIVVSSPDAAATTGTGNGRGGRRGARGGSESDSDGEDDEVFYPRYADA